MKTLIENATKESKYVWADDVVITLVDNMIFTPDFNIGDLNINNATLVLNVTPPEDWYGCKYLYENDAWTANPNWIDPRQSTT
jgi:hypothetical protein